MNTERQLDRIFKKALRAEHMLLEIDELICDLTNPGLVDYHIASNLSRFADRALPPVKDLADYIKTIPYQPQKETRHA